MKWKLKGKEEKEERKNEDDDEEEEKGKFRRRKENECEENEGVFEAGRGQDEYSVTFYETLTLVIDCAGGRRRGDLRRVRSTYTLIFFFFHFFVLIFLPSSLYTSSVFSSLFIRLSPLHFPSSCIAYFLFSLLSISHLHLHFLSHFSACSI